MPVFATENKLGQSSKDIFISQGHPDELLPIRGEKEKDDTILISYNTGISFILKENSIVEIRIDKRYRGSILNLYMNISEENAKEIIEIKPKEEKLGELVFIKDDMEIHLFFYENKLINLTIKDDLLIL